MRSLLRTLVIVAAVVGAAVALFVVATLPPRARALAGSLPPHVLVGAYHVHTSRSDGTGTVDEVAAAAARARLHFVILTDHGDGTRPPLPPEYRHGVLVIDAVEISSSGGHVVALGLQAPAPYALAGLTRDVVEDVHRLGGLAVIAHPESPRRELRWRAGGVPYDGFEWLNADSEWRDERPLRLAGTLLRALVRGPETVVSLFSRSDRAFARWDGRGDQRPPVRAFGLAALDAHARVGWDDEDQPEPRRWTVLARPTYQQMFEAVAQTVLLDAAPAGDPAADARRVLEALAAGRTYTVVRAIGDPGVLLFTAEQGDRIVSTGGDLADGPARFKAAVDGVPDAALALLRNGRVVARGAGALVHDAAVGPGDVYRVEATLGGHPFPWLVSNPIYAGVAPARRAGEPVNAEPPPSRIERFEGYDDWRIEKDPASVSSIAADDRSGALTWRFELGPGVPAGQYAALSVPVESQSGYASVQFDARASRPMRLSFQVRLPGAADSQRWGRSVYLDEQTRRFVIRLEDLEPIGRTSSLRPVAARIRSLLFVVDTVNTLPGSGGTIVLSNVSLALGENGGGG